MNIIADPNNPEAGYVTLTPAQIIALPFLAAGTKKKDVAAAAGVCPQTVSDWLNEPHFSAAVNSKRDELAAHAAARLAEATDVAVSTVVSLMKSTNEAIKFKAATYVLDRILLLEESGSTANFRAVDPSATEMLIALGVNTR